MVFHLEIIKRIEDILNSIGGIIDNIVRAIERFLRDIINTVLDFFQDAINRIVAAIQDIFSKIIDVISGFIESVLESISTTISSIVTFIGDMIDAIVGSIKSFIARALEVVGDIFDAVTTEIIRLTNETVELFVEIFEDIKLNIETLIDFVLTELTQLFEQIKRGVSDIIDEATQVTRSVVEGVETFIREVVDVVGNSLRDLLDTISNLPDTIAALGDALLESARENIADPIIKLPMQLINDLVETLSGAPLAEADNMQLQALNAIFGESPVAQTPEAMREAFNKYMPANPVLKVIITLLVTPLMLLQVYSGIASANSQIVLQEHALVNPYRLMDPPDIVVAKRFDRIEQSTAIDWLRKTGYTESVANILLETSIFTIPPAELVVWWLRDIIDDEQFKVGLEKQGWIQADIDRLRVAAFFIPPVADLITMSVREVFTPDVAERFGQFDDFPPEFVKQAKKQGVSEEWARNYWAAHWALPSVNMGFDMLHRAVIDESDMALLLRATDVMPFWRDKLIQISFNPLTRVDIRRMHKVGVLSEEEVARAYKDVGYNELNAKRLTDFTLRLNGAVGDDNEAVLGELTRSNVLRFYTDGVVDRDTAISVLLASGLSDDAAELFIISADLNIQADERRDSIDTIIEQVKGGIITFEQAQDALNRLELEELEKQRALNTLERAQAKRNKLPTKSDLDKFLDAGIIEDTEYLTNIRLLGFSDLWAQRYLKIRQD